MSCTVGVRSAHTTGFLSNGWHSATDVSGQRTEHADFDWFALTPSEDIVWTPCFSNFQCARLILPLDYLSPPGLSPNASIALQMLPATDKENYKGTILLNPGGPGGSGTSFVRSMGHNISHILGRSYDILGFDPRGTGASMPSANCFDSEAQYRIWQLQAVNLLPNLTDGSLGLVRARERTAALKCEQVLGGNGKEEAGGTVEEWGPGRFMSTASVATDMLKITEKLGQNKLQYWGFSYGSILGQYFAAMYPDKIGRMVIDGVCDASRYRTAIPNTNLVDTDKIINSFHTFCHQSGPAKCPLYEASPQEIQTRFDKIINSVDEEPIPIPFVADGPALLTKKLLYEMTFIAAYEPITMFPYLADLLSAAEANNQTALSSLVHNYLPGYECDCKRSPPWFPSTSALTAIGCGDGDSVSYEPEQHRKNFEGMYAQSPIAAPFWNLHHLRCTEWRIRPKWRYTGLLEAESTSHPLLLISPKYDTVCPLSHARDVHARYGGSGLLVQNSYGHCSTSAPSLCTAKYLRAYFDNGTLPDETSVCEPDELPFMGVVNGTDVKNLSTEDQELLDALRGLSRRMSMFRSLVL